MNRRTLLVEVGCEELPSSALKSLGEGLHAEIVRGLAKRNLEHGVTRWFATPRRLAVEVQDLVEQAPTEEREALGPPLAQAKDDQGAWSKAALGFAKRQGVEADALQVIATPKGDRVGLLQTISGARTAAILAELLEESIAAVPVAKRMRWGSSRLEFARPVQWLLVLFGSEHGFGDVMGLPTGNTTRGHRFHAPDPITIVDPGAYEETLRQAFVIADFQERSDAIREQVKATAAALEASALIEESLLEEVTSLVEWPVALSGAFDEEFLKVPAEALISSMQSHQKYFPVVDAQGGLLPHFITVSNIESKEPQAVVTGNERVIRPRLADAAFFYKQDLQHSLESRIARLDDVVFQKRLGSLGARGRRIAALAAGLAPAVGADEDLARRAGLLCKADLVSEMVLEFADMQGIAGAYYARNDGEPALVADAIGQHYRPLHAGSPLPESAEAVAVALADRLDTLVGIFGIGQPPSGSKDPFGLRRASIAVLRILIEKDLPMDLRACVDAALSGFDPELIDAGTSEKVLAYLLDRMPALFETEAIPTEVFRAVRATGCTEPRDYVRRLRAVHGFRARPEAEALAAANKRVGNILAKAEAGDIRSEVSTDLLLEPAERALFEAINEVSEKNGAALENAAYDAALGELAGLRDTVDRFFDDVMVNAEDPAQRANRLTLLQALRREFLAVADISLLAG